MVPSSAASSAAVGLRPRRASRSASAPRIRAESSCRLRGTRTLQVRSRKWRLISPRMVGNGEARERGAGVRVVAVDGVEQADRGDLDEVVHGLGGVPVAMGEAADERQVTLGERVAQRRIAARLIAAKQRVLLTPAPSRGGRRRRSRGLEHRTLPSDRTPESRPTFPVAPPRKPPGTDRQERCLEVERVDAGSCSPCSRAYARRRRSRARG